MDWQPIFCFAVVVKINIIGVGSLVITYAVIKKGSMTQIATTVLFIITDIDKMLLI